MSPKHPYRAPPDEPPTPIVETDDRVLAVVLFVVGAVGIAVGIAADRALELTLGLIFVVLSIKVAWERHISI